MGESLWCAGVCSPGGPCPLQGVPVQWGRRRRVRVRGGPVCSGGGLPAVPRGIASLLVPDRTAHQPTASLPLHHRDAPLLPRRIHPKGRSLTCFAAAAARPLRYSLGCGRKMESKVAPVYFPKTLPLSCNSACVSSACVFPGYTSLQPHICSHPWDTGTAAHPCGCAYAFSSFLSL